MTSTARAILCSRTGAGTCGRRPGDQRSDLLAIGDPGDVVRPVQVEHHDRKVVLHAQRHRRAIQHLELVAQQVGVLESVVLPSARNRHRIRIVDPVDLGRLEQDLGADLDRTKRGRRVGREVRITGARDEDHDATLLQVAHRPAADVRLGNLIHRDGAHDARRRVGCLDRVLQGKAVHDRREHADVVAGRAVHPLRRRLEATEDVPAADDDADLDAARAHVRDLFRDERAHVRIDAVRTAAEEGLAGQLEQDPAVARRGSRSNGRRAVAHLSSPRAYRLNRRTWMFSPIVAIASVTSSRTLRSSSRNGCSRRTTSLNHFFS
jgi:hypothetical protein